LKCREKGFSNQIFGNFPPSNKPISSMMEILAVVNDPSGWIKIRIGGGLQA